MTLSVALSNFGQQLLGTAAGILCGSYLQQLQSPKSVPPVPPTARARCIEIIRANPQLILRPAGTGPKAIYNQFFSGNLGNSDVTDVNSHPILVDSNGNDIEAGSRHRQIIIQNKSSRGAFILKAFTYTMASVVGIMAIIQLNKNNNIDMQNISKEAILPETISTEIPQEILTDGEIMGKASTIFMKQITTYLPVVILGVSITVAIYFVYERHSKIQLKKEKLILRNLQRINSKLNLLPEEKAKE